VSARERIVVLRAYPCHHVPITGKPTTLDYMGMMHPAWASELKKVGEYYEGFVKNRSLDNKLAEHNSHTFTTFGIRRSINTGVSVESSV